MCLAYVQYVLVQNIVKRLLVWHEKMRMKKNHQFDLIENDSFKRYQERNFGNTRRMDDGEGINEAVLDQRT